MKITWRIIGIVLGMALTIQGCSSLANSQTPPPQVVTVIATAEPPPPEPTKVTSPQCVTQQRLDLRSGPGTAFDPPLQAFETGTVLVPTGFNPVGIPDGAWAQVTYPQSNLTGWVDAGAAFIQCNLDLTTLPAVAVQPTPTRSAPLVSNKPPDGPSDSDIQIEIVMDPNYLMEIRARIEGEANNGDGIDRVTWIIERNGQEVYTESEGNAAFCVFKGGEPDCNPWPKIDGRYTWGEDGPEVEDGEYLATVRVTRDSNKDHYDQWTFTFTIDLP